MSAWVQAWIFWQLVRCRAPRRALPHLLRRNRRSQQRLGGPRRKRLVGGRLARLVGGRLARSPACPDAAGSLAAAGRDAVAAADSPGHSSLVAAGNPAAACLLVAAGSSAAVSRVECSLLLKSV